MNDATGDTRDTCDNCGESTDVGTIPCGSCGVDCRECVDCAEARYCANDGEPTMYTCVFCRKVQKRSPDSNDQSTAPFETGYVDLDAGLEYDDGYASTETDDAVAEGGE